MALRQCPTLANPATLRLAPCMPRPALLRCLAPLVVLVGSGPSPAQEKSLPAPGHYTGVVSCDMPSPWEVWDRKVGLQLQMLGWMECIEADVLADGSFFITAGGPWSPKLFTISGMAFAVTPQEEHKFLWASGWISVPDITAPPLRVLDVVLRGTLPARYGVDEVGWYQGSLWITHRASIRGMDVGIAARLWDVAPEARFNYRLLFPVGS